VRVWPNVSVGVIAEADVPEADIDAFVADFQGSFVPGEAEEEAGPAPETVTVDAGTLRFLRTGEGGEPLVLLHGFGGDLNNWLFNVEPLAAGRAVYALDLPGHGGPTKQVGDGELGFLVAALRGFLDSQGVERAHLSGHSMGGLVAAALALEDPGRVLSLTLVDSAGLGAEIDRDYIEGFVAASSRRELKPVLERLFADAELVTRQMIDEVLKYKRIDGVQEALRALTDRLFADGRQRRVLIDELRSFQSPMLSSGAIRTRSSPSTRPTPPPRAPRRRSCRASGIRHTWRPRATSIEPWRAFWPVFAPDPVRTAEGRKRTCSFPKRWSYAGAPSTSRGLSSVVRALCVAPGSSGGRSSRRPT
jgi:pimeloyl-ACP methyl ester carboxylesterase